MAQVRDVHWWKRAAGFGPMWRRVRRLIPFCTLILRFHIEAAGQMSHARRVALERRLAANLEWMLAERCEACTRPFAPNLHHGGQPQRFCSTTCQQRAAERRQYDRKFRRSTLHGQERGCAECGQRFRRLRDDHRFCSAHCRWVYNGRRARARSAA